MIGILRFFVVLSSEAKKRREERFRIAKEMRRSGEMKRLLLAEIEERLGITK